MKLLGTWKSHFTTLVTILRMFENFLFKKVRKNHLFIQKLFLLLLNFLNVPIIVFINVTGGLLLLLQYLFKGQQAVSAKSQIVSISGFRVQQTKLRILCRYVHNKRESISTRFFLG